MAHALKDWSEMNTKSSNSSVKAYKAAQTALYKRMDELSDHVQTNKDKDAAVLLQGLLNEMLHRARNITNGYTHILARLDDEEDLKKFTALLETNEEEASQYNIKVSGIINKVRPTKTANPTQPDSSKPRLEESLRPTPLTRQHKPDEFRAWRADYAEYYRYNRMHNMDIEDQHAFLKKCLDIELRDEMYNTVTNTDSIFEVPGDPTADYCMDAIDKIFAQIYPLTRRRSDLFEFVTRGQQNGQSMRAFMNAVDAKMLEADVSTMREDDHATMFYTVGCSDPELKREINKLARPTKQQIADMADAAERAGNSVQPPRAAQANQSKKSSPGGRSNGSPRKPDDWIIKRREELKGHCYYCYSTHHASKACTNKANLTCNSCGRPGHVAQACMKRPDRAQEVHQGYTPPPQQHAQLNQSMHGMSITQPPTPSPQQMQYQQQMMAQAQQAAHAHAAQLHAQQVAAQQQQLRQQQQQQQPTYEPYEGEQRASAVRQASQPTPGLAL